MSDARPENAPTSRSGRTGNGLEEADLDIGVLAQMQEAPILAGRIEIVDQNADPDAARGGELQMASNSSRANRPRG